MERIALFRSMKVLTIALSINFIIVNQIQASMVNVKYDKITYHTYIRVDLDQFIDLNLTPAIDEVDSKEYKYSVISDVSIVRDSFDYDSADWSLSFKEEKFYTSEPTYWLSYKKISYQWDGTNWNHVGDDSLTYERYDSYYTLNTPILTPVPEPSTVLLMGLGIIGMGYAKRRKA
jgi:hypothetical protein